VRPEPRRREELLAREAETLISWASHAARSRGRSVPEEEHPLRSAYERDRDRIVHTSAFRKLEYKTQVFVNHEGDYYRTRLTHSLEVAQIARSAARFLRLNEDLAEAIALAHDVGHPPFGHAGEEVLRRLMARHGGFDHNLQGLRVLDRLERRYAEFDGLNLTWEVREAFVKHGSGIAAGQGVLDFREYAESPWPSAEAQLVDACDAIAYNAHDVDDGLAAGLVTLDQLAGIPLWRDTLDRLPEEAHRDPVILRHTAVRSLIDEMVRDLVEATLCSAAELRLGTSDDVRAAPRAVVALSAQMSARCAELRSFLFAHVYRHFRVVRMWHKSQRLMSAIFSAYMEHPEQLPPLARERIGSDGVARVVADYLAGLTDREAVDEHQRLFDPRRLT
jgi:dGTPase